MEVPALDARALRVRSVPTLEEAVDKLGALRERLDAVTAERDRQRAEVDAEFGPQVETLDDAIDDQLTRIGAYVRDNRAALFGKKKSVQLPSGKVAIQAGRTVAVVEDEAAAIEALRGRRGKVAACLVTKPSLVKTELAKQQPEIPGVRYDTTRERIQVTPARLGTVVSAELAPAAEDDASL